MQSFLIWKQILYFFVNAKRKAPPLAIAKGGADSSYDEHYGRSSNKSGQLSLRYCKYPE